MSFKLLPVWTAVEVPVLIQCTLEWHMENKTPLQLMVNYRTDALPAHIIAMDEEHMLVHCQGMPRLNTTQDTTYTLLGRSAGGDVLIDGQIQRIADSGDVFTLRIPQRINVGMPEEYLAVATGLSATPASTVPRTTPRPARNCRASHRIIGNGLCIRQGALHWFSHLRRIV